MMYFNYMKINGKDSSEILDYYDITVTEIKRIYRYIDKVENYDIAV